LTSPYDSSRGLRIPTRRGLGSPRRRQVERRDRREGVKYGKKALLDTRHLPRNDMHLRQSKQDVVINHDA